VEHTNRLVQRLLTEPGVAGCLRYVKQSDITSSSGAPMLYGIRDGPVEAAHAQAASPNPVGSFPVIVKLGAGAREVHWATQLARHAPDVVPGVYAAGSALGGEPAPWLIMERCAERYSDDWPRAPWKHRVFTTLLDAGVRFNLAARRIAPPVGPANVDVAWLSGLVRRALTGAPSGPRALAERVVARLARDWAWVLSVCRVELAHGDRYPGNPVWRTAPSSPVAQALLVDDTPGALPWALEAAYCAAVYWGGGTGHPAHATTTHEMAALRAAYGLEVPARADVDRLATLCGGWQAMRLWPTRTRYHGRPRYEAAVARAIGGAALA
jgi:hypothetical protein